ncbi:conserved hypothetical protein [Paecilomyces variotii No. 5]|uniref:Uncharacterized protein n=1 Tax=Byssochlamys spectabilis (strain No. 5 / NBRC 109023) TaxID=1356009 RepID=V5GAR8_BYSSN|nr:conserved hypothetical protein [Paecilomyces variotii No. 5]
MEPKTSRHRRNISSRSSRPRSSTKGPLEATDDPLSGTESPKSPLRSHIQSPTSPERSRSPLGPLDNYDSIQTQLDHILKEDASALKKDLSFLLRPDIYHPLSQLEIPVAFRAAFTTPSPGEGLPDLLKTLDKLLTEGHFLLAAHLCGTLLTSHFVSPTDSNTILTLFYIRLACLELTGNGILAAQESKALEDLNSSFYYVSPDLEITGEGRDQSQKPRPRHIAPWPLRVLAVRLQSIGFGDARRSIAGLYEIGLEARQEIMRPGIDKAEKQVWKDRLADLGLRSVNALIEMGDLDAARRSLESLQGPGPESDTKKLRKALLNIRIGDVETAKEILNESTELGEGILKPLLDMAEGRYDDAVGGWKSLLEKGTAKDQEAMFTNNLAVCLLYTGKLNESRKLLESLLAGNNSFQSLTFNLATIYELCSDKSRNLKLHLADEVAKQPHTGDTNIDRPNADFKL